MSKIEIQNEFMSYPESLLEVWNAGDHSMFPYINALLSG